MFLSDLRDEFIEELPDGFERFGPKDSPFLLRSGGQLREEASVIHSGRDTEDQRDDERSNEEITRNLDLWAENLWAYDVPFTDTIPLEELLNRAEVAADSGMSRGYVSEIEFDSDIDGFGLYKAGNNEIHVSAEDSGFLGTSEAVILAHETGHAFHVGVKRLNRKPGFDEEFEVVFETDVQREHAIELSERLRGPIPDSPNGYRSYRLRETGLFADVFASLMIEPDAARRVGPEAVGRVEGLLGSEIPDTD